MDVGEETDIHPQKKEPVGQRLALAARGIAYGEKIPYKGPTFKDAVMNGEKVVLSFENVEGGLEARGGELHGFSIAGEDHKFIPAQATIQGDQVIVTAPGITNAKAVRYAWANYPKPEANLFNKAGLPAVPFRTDDLPWTTIPK
jgi:sialate O-acetylesterase